MGWESSDVVRFDLGHLPQGQMRIDKLKSAYTLLLLVLEVCNVKPTYLKSWAGESSDVFRFDLGTLLRGRMRIAHLKVLITLLLLVLEAYNVKPTHRKSWAGNLLMWSDLTFDPSSRSNNNSLALVSCVSCGYKFTLVLRCVGLIMNV